MITVTSNKNFGLFFAFVFFLISSYQYFNSSNNYLFFLSLSILFFILAFTLNFLLLPLNLLWENFGKLLHKFTSIIMLSLIYFLVFTTIGTLMKLFRFDPFGKKLKNNNSFWNLRKTEVNTFKDLF